MNQRRFMTGIAVAATVAAGAVAAPAAASASPAAEDGQVSIQSQFECGIVSCSYVFTRSMTNFIADNGGLASTVACGKIPPPGTYACGVGFVVVIATSKIAKSKNSCTKFNFAKVAPYPTWTSVDGGSRCKS
ncbi:hypothetical protein SAMN05421504_101920 [Amycolatopsis xylanica]|uniref:Tat (Twin-arginine translocation) pathway signal sequence n=1 Tax=Amycolatopsis xylanica TaxID=589385 RepID=A0A1H2UKN3_9PSEU|nr:hypothetical protein [Amycolatopsis xylanica]SDW56746.1 hypothetical protein SAMN05421504_101920 [Amycolatopsis xylanica]